MDILFFWIEEEGKDVRRTSEEQGSKEGDREGERENQPTAKDKLGLSKARGNSDSDLQKYFWADKA